MKKSVLLFFSAISLGIYAQSPGGVSGIDIWCKVNKVTPTGSTFQYKDFSINNKAITTGAGTVLTNSLFNYNYSFSYDNTDYVSYLSKLEKLKEATIFIVNLPTPPANPLTKYGLMSTDWNPSVPVNAGSVNEQSFQFSTSTFEKNGFSLMYPSGTSPRPNGRINTVLWHNFNSRKIVNSFGSSGESNVFIGKSFTNASSFVGEIPEVIVYRKALNDKEKLRVESYLALKYGITLQPDVNYYTSKNEIFWHKENNPLFYNRIFGIGRDSNSSLYQKQSTSIHDLSVLKKMVFWTGTFQADNNQNTSYIDDQNFLTIGDNNDTELPNITLNNGIKKLNRTWLVEKFGPSSHSIVTSLKYKPDSSITLLPNEAFWLLVDKSANNTTLSTFNGTNISYYPVTSFDSNGYAVYNNLQWASETTTYNQFTFGKGPRMLVIPTVASMACNASQGNVTIAIKGGQPSFTINVNGINNAYNLQLTQPSFNLSLTLNTGYYQVTVTDATGYTSQPVTFEISPTPGIALELGPNQNLIQGNTLLLNAGANVTASGVTYKWYKNNVLIATTSTLQITQAGTYKCEITNPSNNCVVSDTIVITLVQVSPITNPYSVVSPNPSRGSFKVKLTLPEASEASFTLYDISGKLLSTIQQKGLEEYEESFNLYTSGIYFLKVETKDYSTTHKIIIN